MQTTIISFIYLIYGNYLNKQRSMTLVLNERLNKKIREAKHGSILFIKANNLQSHGLIYAR